MLALELLQCTYMIQTQFGLLTDLKFAHAEINHITWLYPCSAEYLYSHLHVDLRIWFVVTQFKVFQPKVFNVLDFSVDT